jgi:coenzyme PQQ precursor peptide PqqA
MGFSRSVWRLLRALEFRFASPDFNRGAWFSVKLELAQTSLMSDGDFFSIRALYSIVGARFDGRTRKMAWTTPTLVEICIGLEINGYLPPEF